MAKSKKIDKDMGFRLKKARLDQKLREYLINCLLLNIVDVQQIPQSLYDIC